MDSCPAQPFSTWPIGHDPTRHQEKKEKEVTMFQTPVPLPEENEDTILGDPTHDHTGAIECSCGWKKPGAQLWEPEDDMLDAQIAETGDKLVEAIEKLRVDAIEGWKAASRSQLIGAWGWGLATFFMVLSVILMILLFA
jgi:hypothetical protein